MDFTTGCCLSVVFALNTYAASESAVPSHLIKINKEANPQCVVYVKYKGELFCSTLALDSGAIDPKLIASEQQIIQFDERPWKAAWAKKGDNQILTIEYVPENEDINHWQELVTSQFIPGLQNASLEEFAKRSMGVLSKDGINPIVKVIENQPDQFILEFRIESPSNLQQDELQKITRGKDGLYILHYVIKKSDMGVGNRKKWIENLKKSTLKNVPQATFSSKSEPICPMLGTEA